jgi:hypothetical protein
MPTRFPTVTVNRGRKQLSKGKQLAYWEWTLEATDIRLGSAAMASCLLPSLLMKILNLYSQEHKKILREYI